MIITGPKVERKDAPFLLNKEQNTAMITDVSLVQEEKGDFYTQNFNNTAGAVTIATYLPSAPVVLQSVTLYITQRADAYVSITFWLSKIPGGSVPSFGSITMISNTIGTTIMKYDLPNIEPEINSGITLHCAVVGAPQGEVGGTLSGYFK